MIQCAVETGSMRGNMTEKETELRGSRVSDVQKGHSNSLLPNVALMKLQHINSYSIL